MKEGGGGEIERRESECLGSVQKFRAVHISLYMNNHIYSTLFKTQERESDKRSKEIEQRKELKKHTNKTTRTCNPKY